MQSYLQRGGDRDDGSLTKILQRIRGWFGRCPSKRRPRRCIYDVTDYDGVIGQLVPRITMTIAVIDDGLGRRTAIPLAMLDFSLRNWNCGRNRSRIADAANNLRPCRRRRRRRGRIAGAKRSTRSRTVESVESRRRIWNGGHVGRITVLIRGFDRGIRVVIGIGESSRRKEAIRVFERI